MKLFVAGAVLLSLGTLSGCATPPADPAAGTELASVGTVYEDKGETFTGSRIPQKSTTHVLKRVGNADYKKAKNEANGGNVDTSGAFWGNPNQSSTGR